MMQVSEEAFRELCALTIALAIIAFSTGLAIGLLLGTP